MRASSLRHLLLPAFVVLASAACGARTGISTGERDDASVPDASPEASPDAKPDAPILCASPRRACFTTAELIELWNHPPETGQRDAGPPPLDPNGCLPHLAVSDDCCNRAVDGPTIEADTCCYDFCSNGCCDGIR